MAEMWCGQYPLRCGSSLLDHHNAWGDISWSDVHEFQQFASPLEGLASVHETTTFPGTSPAAITALSWFAARKETEMFSALSLAAGPHPELPAGRGCG